MSGAKKGEDFSNFKIGGMPGFGPGAGMASTPAKAPTPKINVAETPAAPVPPEEQRFPHLEQLLECDNETILEMANTMGEVCQQLDELIAKRSGRIKQEAQKARQAYEHTFNLIDYLIEIKESLLNPPEPETK